MSSGGAWFLFFLVCVLLVAAAACCLAAVLQRLDRSQTQPDADQEAQGSGPGALLRVSSPRPTIVYPVSYSLARPLDALLGSHPHPAAAASQRPNPRLTPSPPVVPAVPAAQEQQGSFESLRRHLSEAEAQDRSAWQAQLGQLDPESAAALELDPLRAAIASPSALQTQEQEEETELPSPLAHTPPPDSYQRAFLPPPPPLETVRVQPLEREHDDKAPKEAESKQELEVGEEKV